MKNEESSGPLHFLGIFVISFVLVLALSFVLSLIIFNTGFLNSEANHFRYFWLGISGILSVFILHHLVFFSGKFHLHSGHKHAHLAAACIFIALLLLFQLLPFSYYLNSNNQSEGLKTKHQQEFEQMLFNLINPKTNELDSLKLQEALYFLQNGFGDWTKIHAEPGNFTILFPDGDVQKEENERLVDSQEILVHSIASLVKYKDIKPYQHRIDYMEKRQYAFHVFAEDIKSKLEQSGNLLKKETFVNNKNSKEHTMSFKGREESSVLKLVQSENFYYAIFVQSKDTVFFDDLSVKFINSFELE
ncbi:MAG: hypothetical protein H0X62_01280 [Bacteroidetes bacterium]|nr:hypothetical protein [Bacteroidota bacterium]